MEDYIHDKSSKTSDNHTYAFSFLSFDPSKYTITRKGIAQRLEIEDSIQVVFKRYSPTKKLVRRPTLFQSTALCRCSRWYKLDILPSEKEEGGMRGAASQLRVNQI
ncbi:hypothetical protein Dimus_025877 [Dionaea muscipula]